MFSKTNMSINLYYESYELLLTYTTHHEKLHGCDVDILEPNGSVFRTKHTHKYTPSSLKIPRSAFIREIPSVSRESS
jgi:hypothetical protein